jgi:hypothetical protein
LKAKGRGRGAVTAGGVLLCGAGEESRRWGWPVGDQKREEGKLELGLVVRWAGRRCWAGGEKVGQWKIGLSGWREELGRLRGLLGRTVCWSARKKNKGPVGLRR